MNFQDLYKKIAAIEEGSMPPVAPTHTDGPTTDECGDMMGPSDPPKQQDNVTMNVSMNGSGAGGIRDLMGILKHIESGGDHMDPHPHDVEKLFGDDYENSPEGGSEPEVYGIDAVTQTGNDMHSKGIEEPKVSGGGNPMQEALVSRLSLLYQAIKEEIQQQDLGDGFMLTSIEAFGSTRPAVLDTQSNTYFILNRQEDGSAIARTPAKYLTIKDGKTGASMGGPATNAAFQKAGLSL
jgi:hypothetical protein